MDSLTTARAFDFPPQLEQAEIENRCARESFTWGPQALWLLCGLIWLFCLLVRDVPEVLRNVVPYGVGATLLGLLAVWYERRRRRRRRAFYPVGGRIGCYSGHLLQYSFGRGEMVRVRTDFVTRLMIVLKLLAPMLLLVVIVAVVLWDGLRQDGAKQAGSPGWQDMAVFVYLIFYAIFGFVALYRSHFRLAFFWIPNGKGKTNSGLYLKQGELKKLEGGDGRAIG
jgi:hypothetical protein